jgi:hypothetical protein
LSIITVPFLVDVAWVSVIWFVESLLLFTTFLKFKNKFFELFSYWMCFGTAFSVPFYYGLEWMIYAWLIETLVLFILARLYCSLILEKISYVLLFFSLFGLLRIWDVLYFQLNLQENDVLYYPHLANIGVLVVLALLLVLNQTLKPQHIQESKSFSPIESLLHHFFFNLHDYLVVLMLILVYCFGVFEINFYFDKLARLIDQNTTEDAHKLINAYGYRGTLYGFIFTAFYLIALIHLHLFVWKNLIYRRLISGGGLGLSILFLVIGCSTIEYLISAVEGYEDNSAYLLLRFWVYLALFGFVGSFLALIWKAGLSHIPWAQNYTIWLNIFVLAVLSFEVVQYFRLNYSEGIFKTAFKFGFSILWALYSLGLISTGIWRKRRYLRFTGFAIFGVTLLKLFLFDISYYSALSVIFAFIGVGVLLLITAFLYQKFKHIILEKDA